MHRILSLARIPRWVFLLFFLFSPCPPPLVLLRERPLLIFVFPLPSVECVASALTHCQKERGLSQWLACVHEEEEEEDEEAAAAASYEGEEEEEEDEDEEETITIEGVCPGRRRCFPILFLVNASLDRLYSALVPLYSFFYPSFAPLSPIRPPDGLFARDAPVARAKITGANAEEEKENHGTNPVQGLFIAA